jgi:restriction endonuclease S subunit
LENNVKNTTIVSTGFVVIRNKNEGVTIPKYLYHLLTTEECVSYLNNYSVGIFKAFKSDDIMKYELNVPPLEVQQKVLDKISTLTNSIESLSLLKKEAEDTIEFTIDCLLNQS